MSETYLLATDGSEPARAAEEYVLEVLDPANDEVVVVSVTESLPPGLLKEGESLTTNPDAIRSQITESMRETAESIQDRLEAEGFKTSVTLLAGDPGEEICEFAKKVEPAGIIMGRRGHGEVTELLIGSVTQYVVHHADVPVIIAPTLSET